MNQSGLTLLEVVLATALIAILAGVSIQMVSGNQNAEKYEQTRAKMEILRTAIFGDDALDAKGEKLHFGYFGDMGMMPQTLTSLTTQGTQPSWTYNTTYGIGAGWRGPYYVDPYTTSLQVDLDAWGTSFVYSLSGTPSITSKGSDLATGTTGDVYSKDLVMTFDSALRLSSVRGFVRDGDTRIPNAIVELRYPSAGVISSVITTSASDGSYTFNTVPPSLAAISVSSVPTTGSVSVGPRRVAIAGPQFLIPNFLMNYYGSKQRVITAGAASASTNTVTINLSNSYETALNLDYMTIYWSGGTSPAFIETVAVDGAAAQNISIGGVCLSSGTRTNQMTTGQTFPVNDPSTSYVLAFRPLSNCTGALGGTMSGANFYIQFEWKETKERDVISFAVP